MLSIVQQFFWRIMQFNMLAARKKVLDSSSKKDLILNKTIKKQWNN